MKSNLLLILLCLHYTMCLAQFSEQQIITTNAAGARSVHAADIDGDGYMDVLSASEGDDKVAWYENSNGQGDFIVHIITENLNASVDVYTIDIDGDGDIDVVVASKGYNANDSSVVWFENLDGQGNFGTQQVITTLTNGALSVYAIDLDGDGDNDVLSASFNDNKIAWYENLDGQGNFGTQQIITNNAYNVRSVFATDIDGDGDMDVLCDSSGNGSGHPSWYENLDGLGAFGPEQEITQESGSQFTIAADIDGDGDMDVLNVNFGGGLIYLSKNTDGLGNFGAIEIISELVKPVKIYATDLDNDGDIDIASITHDNDGTTGVYWHENIDGLGNFSEKQTISTNIIGGRGVFAADLDGDGDMDALSASIADDKIAWYKNLTILGVENNNNIDAFIFYPNPVSTVLNINNNNMEINKIEIYNVLGKKVWVTTDNTTQIDVSNLDNGLYLVNIQSEQGVLVKKVIKQ